MTSFLSVLGFVSAALFSLAVAASLLLLLIWLLGLRNRSQRRGFASKAAGGALSKGVQVSVSLTMITREALAQPDEIRVLSAMLTAHGIGPDDLMHILVPRTMCHDLTVARCVAAATIVSRARDLCIADGVLSFTDVIEPYLKWASDRALLPQKLSSATLYDRTPSDSDSDSDKTAVKEYEVSLENSKRKRFVASLVVCDSLLFLKNQALAQQLKNSCVGCAGRGARRLWDGCVEA